MHTRYVPVVRLFTSVSPLILVPTLCARYYRHLSIDEESRLRDKQIRKSHN